VDLSCATSPTGCRTEVREGNIAIFLRCTREVEARDEALGRAKLAAAEQQQIVQGIHQALIALSEHPAIKAKDADGCNAYLSRISSGAAVDEPWSAQGQTRLALYVGFLGGTGRSWRAGAGDVGAATFWRIGLN
jgi:hypothetical protein